MGKVLSFIELFNLSAEEMLHYKRQILGDDSEYSLLDFYSQPFRPELITELFECKSVETETYINIHIGENTIEIDNVFNMIHYNEYTFERLPRTLDEFITDCQRAGIELFWRIGCL